MKTMAKLQKMKDNKKGFTLVELIVVLVILAILLAILVPSLVGWISKARDKQVIVNARNAYLAVETVIQENDGTLTGSGYELKAGAALVNGTTVIQVPKRVSSSPAKLATEADLATEIGNLANYDTNLNNIFIKLINPDTGALEEMTFYDDNSGKYAVLAGGAWTVYQKAADLPAGYGFTLKTTP